MFRNIKALPACAVAASVALAVQATPAQAQSADNEAIPLPPVVVEQSAVPAPKAKKKTAAKKGAKQVQPVAATPAEPAAASNGIGTTARSGSLSVANTAEARAEMQQTPGGVELVPDTAYKGSTPATSVKDVLDYVPGVFVQPKWGDDTRLSIRGSSLSRNFHLRSIQLFMDGIPIN
ncbi:MAG TPA: Plug domain-containing protein, partial [Hyphomicrobium sp.]|nr:Plug domain-containing protein [Hyphomicrobium sp.]